MQRRCCSVDIWKVFLVALLAEVGYGFQHSRPLLSSPRSTEPFPPKHILRKHLIASNQVWLRQTSDSQPSKTDEDVAKKSSSSPPEALKKASSLPSYRKLIVFTATTILIWLSEPLLSLVDTTIVGWKCDPASAVVQIAALGPATTLYDSTIYMTYFLAIATTNQLAPALARKQWKELRQKTSHVMGLSLIFGALVSLVIFGFGNPMIVQMTGESIVSNPEIVPLAANYAKIRAAVAPICLLGMVAQSFCLTCLDTVTPAIAVAVAVVNVVGDWILSPKYGIAGASIATAAATVASTVILAKKVLQTTAQWRQNQIEEERRGIPKTTISKVVDGSVELVASTSNVTNATSSGSQPYDHETETDRNHIPFASIPDRKSTIDLMKLAGPIFFVMMAKIVCYSIMTVRATKFGIVPLATHNIMMRIFFFFACFGDSLSQAAQSFYPSVSKDQKNRLLRRLVWLALGMGVWNSQVAAVILERFGSILTKEASILHLMAGHTTFLALGLLLHPLIMVFEGTVLARRDLLFLVGSYGMTLASHLWLVFSPISSSFDGLWRALFAFQALRLTQFGWRVASSLGRKKGKETELQNEVSSSI